MRLGSSGLGECPFSLPTHPVAEPGEAESLQSVADGLGGSAHTPAVLLAETASRLWAHRRADTSNLRGVGLASP